MAILRNTKVSYLALTPSADLRIVSVSPAEQSAAAPRSLVPIIMTATFGWWTSGISPCISLHSRCPIWSPTLILFTKPHPKIDRLLWIKFQCRMFKVMNASSKFAGHLEKGFYLLLQERETDTCCQSIGQIWRDLQGIWCMLCDKKYGKDLCRENSSMETCPWRGRLKPEERCQAFQVKLDLHGEMSPKKALKGPRMCNWGVSFKDTKSWLRTEAMWSAWSSAFGMTWELPIAHKSVLRWLTLLGQFPSTAL